MLLVSFPPEVLGIIMANITRWDDIRALLLCSNKLNQAVRENIWKIEAKDRYFDSRILFRNDTPYFPRLKTIVANCYNIQILRKMPQVGVVGYIDRGCSYIETRNISALKRHDVCFDIRGYKSSSLKKLCRITSTEIDCIQDDCPSISETMGEILARLILIYPQIRTIRVRSHDIKNLLPALIHFTGHMIIFLSSCPLSPEVMEILKRIPSTELSIMTGQQRLPKVGDVLPRRQPSTSGIISQSVRVLHNPVVDVNLALCWFPNLKADKNIVKY